MIEIYAHSMDWRISNHAIERFAQRFPDHDLIESLRRSVPLSTRQYRRMTGHVPGGRDRYDPMAEAIYVVVETGQYVNTVKTVYRRPVVPRVRKFRPVPKKRWKR